ncbi:MAG: hypothetical protein ACR2HV_07200 [Acidimicrobiales bacterium]
MQGTMRQRATGSWELKVYLGRDAVSGKKRWAFKTVRCGKRDAQRALAAMAAQAERGALARTASTTGQLLEEWFDHAKADFSPKTVRETRGVLDRYLIPGMGEVPLAKLGAADLDRFYRRLREKGGRAGKPLSPGTIRRVHGVLHRALAQGVRWGWLAQNHAHSCSAMQRTDLSRGTPTR